METTTPIGRNRRPTIPRRRTTLGGVGPHRSCANVCEGKCKASKNSNSGNVLVGAATLLFESSIRGCSFPICSNELSAQASSLQAPRSQNRSTFPTNTSLYLIYFSSQPLCSHSQGPRLRGCRLMKRIVSQRLKIRTAEVTFRAMHWMAMEIRKL